MNYQATYLLRNAWAWASCSELATSQACGQKMVLAGEKFLGTGRYGLEVVNIYTRIPGSFSNLTFFL
jgi:hypothetical protein